MNASEFAVREYRPGDRDTVVQLIAEFRVALSALRGYDRQADVSQAESELQEYIDNRYPIFVATTVGEAESIGYMVYRVDGDTVWAESLFVSPEFRRRGVAGMLYDTGEKFAEARGQETLYNWVHPNNDAIIAFLKKRGYDVLNLIEVRRRRPGEEAAGVIQVGDHRYAY
ncbi:MAG TPA: GNAT family N-acetyltransferase [Chloroflexi bacterium]|nr:GNAT family N-acetyltransferase [Chloroflexota bacterium]